ncbi:unnamed protein product [Durusdinium trenchii]|uniref:Ribosome biogenesis protein NOP53 n=1 Tax=Durusdinium trenchii TaxID=1381693 RepID=A0ABP0S8L4_9DINO
MRAWGECDHDGREVRPVKKKAVSKASAASFQAASASLDDELDKYFGKEAPAPCVESLKPEEMQDRKVAAMLLRSARTKVCCKTPGFARKHVKVEEAEEKGLTAYLEEEAHLDMRVNKRLLAGEVSQARSFNKRAGVEPLPAVVQETAPLTLQEREAKALELEYVRSSHRLRGTNGSTANIAAPLRKKQRVGTQGELLDLAALEREARRQADEDVALVNPVLRPPPKLVKRIAVKINR